MSRVDVGQLIIIHIQHGIYSRDEHALFCVGQQQFVDTRQGLGRRCRFDHSGVDKSPRERHEERGGNALVGDIGNEESQLIIRQVKDIIKVTAHLTGSLPTRGKFPVLELRQRFRDEGLLNLARQLHFRFEAFAYHHLFLQEIVLNRERDLLRNARDDLEPACAEANPPAASSINITP